MSITRPLWILLMGATAIVFGLNLLWTQQAARRSNDAIHRAQMAAATAKSLAASTRKIAVENANAIYYVNHFRITRIHETAKADLKLCKAINIITARDRATILASPTVTKQQLELLGVKPPALAAILEAAKKNAQHEIFARPFLKCHRLPSQPK